VIIAYGQIIPRRLLSIPPLGWINVHASLLPRFRGAAPIHWAIARGEQRTGVTTMQLDAGMDTGPILEQLALQITADETTPELSARLSQAGAELIVQSLLRLYRGEISPVAQNSIDASYAPILKKEDGRIDWNCSARVIFDRMRGFTPWPGAYTSFREQNCQIWGRPDLVGSIAAPVSAGQLLQSPDSPGIWYVACGEGSFLRLEFLQLQGRKRITAQEFANGARLSPSDRFL